ncbi:MAG: (2Fe-2S) ferredoxin domain-containing protein [Pseudobdellovibrionaceae bacterium]
MKKEKVPWSEASVLICTKCHLSFAPGQLQEEGNCGENLKNHLRAKGKTQGLNEKVRVMTSSCLHICQAGQQAVLIQPVQTLEGKTGPTEIWTLHPESDREEFFALLSQSY